MRVRYLLILFLPLACAPSCSPDPPEGGGSAQARSLFADPPRDFSSGPLWVWNDLLTDEQVRETLRDLAGQKIKQVWVHPRPGLMTPYLSEEWFRLWQIALQEAERLDLNVWIYDENSYPSGFAGGLVPEAMPESRGRGLVMRRLKAAVWSQDTLAVFRLEKSGYENITEQVRGGRTFPRTDYLAATLARAKPAPWHGGKYYVDLLYPGVTEKFLALTMEAYRREIGEHFGKRVPGVFTDEPHLRPAGGLPWTDGLPQLFEQRWGYSLTDNLPALNEALGDWKRIRHNYYQLLLEQFIERWAKPYYEYCRRNGLEFTGHYWEHEWPNCVRVPDNMALSAWQQRPGIDTLMNQYREDTHAQFGNVRAVKEISSVANQLGRARTLCEAYGAGGWDLRFEDMKRIGDWLYVLGINTLNQHLSYVTLRGARKRDHPQSFSYHEPWWEAYHLSAAYFARLSLALTTGEQVNHILLLEPTTTAWMYCSDGKAPPEIDRLGDSFQSLVLDFEKAQLEYDIGCEDILARHGSAAGGELHVGRRAYDTVIIPPFTENLNAATLGLLESFAGGGGTLLACGEPPERVDGIRSERAQALLKSGAWKKVDTQALAGSLQARAPGPFMIRRAAKDKGLLFHHRRQLEDGQMLFLVNSSMEFPQAGSVESDALGAERWDLDTGDIIPYPMESADRGSRIRFELPPSGSLLLFLAKEKRGIAPEAVQKLIPIDSSPPKVRRVEPNVLVIDYMDVTAAGESRKGSYFYQASQFAFMKNGMERNPWDSAVQFRDELLRKSFPPESGVEAAYRFTIRERVPSSLSAVVERPDLYRITCNGVPVAADEGSWWLDRAFGRFDIASSAKVGENVIRLRASPFTIYHELEPLYLLGDFALNVLQRGFEIVPERGLEMGEWNRQGHPFYSAGVSYLQEFNLAEISGQYRISLPRWYGSVTRVAVNGRPAGFIAYPPWQLDITKLVRPGANSVEVTVIGTLKNTLGPHHGNPALGSAWPRTFQNGPSPGPPAGDQYSTVGYGLMEPIRVIQVTQ